MVQTDGLLGTRLLDSPTATLSGIYDVYMTKRLIEIDDNLLERARAASGAATIKATVEEGLRAIVQRQLLERHVARVRRPAAIDYEAIEAANDARLHA